MSYKQIGICILFSVCCSLSLTAKDVAGQNSSKPSCMRGLIALGKVLRSVYRWPFKEAGSATMEGAYEEMLNKTGFSPSQDPIPPFNPDGMSAKEQTMQEIVELFFNALSKATDPTDKTAAGTQFWRNLVNNGAITIGDLYNKDGEGRKALVKIFKTFKEYINDDGYIKEIIEDIRKLAVDQVKELFIRFEELNLDDGAARKAVHATVQNVKEGVQEIGQAVDTSSRKLVRNVLIGGVLLMSSWFLWKHIDRNWRTPGLVLETSHKNALQRLGGFFFGSTPREIPKMILPPELKERLNSIAFAIRNIRSKIRAGHKNIKYRNLLLWGPPGTGKTMFARILAEYSGMEYAIMSGSSFSQYRNGEGITQMNKLFEWAKNSSNGLLIVIDECEAFLGGRAGSEVTDDSYQLLTNFLNLTGERSNKVMIVFSSNRPQMLDEAMKRRIDDAVEMPLPGYQERVDILKLYRDRLLIDPRHNTQEFIESAVAHLDKEALELVAHDTDGLSGGELEGIINGLISDASVTKEGLISYDLVQTAVGHMVDKHQSFKQGFNQAAAAA